ncbi:MAG: zinc finger, RING-type domain-containing protein [Acidobacteriota bacterium]
MSAQVELWRVSTADGVFEANLETLKQWIAEGCVLPTDKVSKGNLNWIDAGQAPMLKGAFSGDRVELAAVPPPKPSLPSPGPPVMTQTTTIGPDVDPEQAEPMVNTFAPVVASASEQAFADPSCHNHPDKPPEYVCRICSEVFCKECTKVVRSIRLCPLCGDLCKPYEQVMAKAVSQEFQTSQFGFSDFARAIRYPFQHKVALVCGAFVYGLLLLGGMRTGIIAYVIMFGCMSHAISQVAWGRLSRSFMPDFSEFSVLDDLVQPIVLGIGITIVSWGPVIVLLLALLFGVLSNAPRLSPLGTPDIAATEQPGPTHEDFSVLLDPNADPKKLEEANKKLNELRPGAEINRQAEQTKHQDDPTSGLQMLLPYLGAGIALAALLLLGIVWAIFYYPMALAVAGYTQSFGSVINPLVGLDTIRRMGGTYFKAFGMVLLVQVVALVINLVVAFVTSPLALPFIGNLPAKFIDGTVTFYFNLVIACVLGLSLYKSADRLGINVD